VRRLARLARLLGAPLAVADAPMTLDAIVVLGAPLLADGRPSDVVDERLTAALDLWRRGGAPIVCVSGGTTGAGHNEADAMAEALLARGLPAAALRRERASRSTDANARLSAALLAAEGVRSVWLVTQPFHGRRARRCFRRAGLDAHVWAIADSLQHRQPRRALRWITREYAAWLREAVRRGTR
jgi:uncharacterized SAM-binding protein YcdF (DUF218 family)